MPDTTKSDAPEHRDRESIEDMAQELAAMMARFLKLTAAHELLERREEPWASNDCRPRPPRRSA